MKKTLLTFGAGFLGGILPLSAFLFFNQGSDIPNKQAQENRILMDESAFPSRFVNDLPNLGPIDFREASKNTIHSVVHVQTIIVQKARSNDPLLEFFYGPQSRVFKGEASGSGVLISTDGYIVTNNHVVENATEIKITLNDNSSYDAKIIGTDPSTDIALLKIEGDNFSAIPVGNSEIVEIGEWVLAVGNPFNLTSTVTAGIVSAKGRNINIIGSNQNENRNIIPIESFIQTDAAVNPGNSGGALVNTKGELIGINTAIASNTGSYTGYSFAIPVNLVKKVVNDLMEFGMVQRGYLGVSIANISQELMDKEKLSSQKGVWVSGLVESGSAKIAGIKEGDIISKIDSKEIGSVAELQEYIGKKRPGDKVIVHILRNGLPVELTVILKTIDGDTKLVSKAEASKKSAFGASFELVSPKELKELKIVSGVKINQIDYGKFKNRGFYEGVIITKVNNQDITDVEAFVKLLNESTEPLLLEVVHPNGKRDYIGFGE